MAKVVVNGAALQCSMGLSPGTLTVTPENMTNGANQPIGTVMDFIPLANIGSFGMCQSMANPDVASATAAAMGVLTPFPCIPVTTAAWTPGATVTTINSNPVLLATDKCTCQWAGMISITSPGQTVIDAQ